MIWRSVEEESVAVAVGYVGGSAGFDLPAGRALEFVDFVWIGLALGMHLRKRTQIPLRALTSAYVQPLFSLATRSASWISA